MLEGEFLRGIKPHTPLKVSTKDGYRVVVKAGNFVGEGYVLFVMKESLAARPNCYSHLYELS
jgi:hypothetical protein